MGRPRKRRREDGAPEEVDFNDVEDSAQGVVPQKMPEIGQQDFHVHELPLPYVSVGIGSDGNLAWTPDFTSGHPQNFLPTGSDPLTGDFETILAHEAPEMNFDNLTSNPIGHNHFQTTAYPTPPSTESAVNGGTCTCLSTSYLTLAEISDPEPRFPAHVPKLKNALRTASNVIECTVCPKQPLSAMQNIMMTTTLMTTIIEGYRKILKHIEFEASKAEAEGTSLSYRMGDSRPENWHLHTGTLDCPMGFNVDLDPAEFRMIAKKVVKADILGKPNAPAEVINIMGLAERFEKRQHRWHAGESSSELRAHFAKAGDQCKPESGHVTCLQLLAMVKQHVAMLDI